MLRALRLTQNQSGNTLLTTTPVVDLSEPVSNSPIYFPQFVDGGGYTTSLILLNNSTGTERGTIRIYANDGSNLSVTDLDGAAGSTFRYFIVPGGAFHFQTNAARQHAIVGWAELTPDPGSSSPAGAGIFHYSADGVLLTESGVPAAVPTNHARIFIDMSDGHDTGVALANPQNDTNTIMLRALQMDGSPYGGADEGVLSLPGKGHESTFVYQQIAGLPEGFRGILDIFGTEPFLPLTIRSLVNEQGQFLLTTFPVADLNQSAHFPAVFPQIVDGGGYTTEFIIFSVGSSVECQITFTENREAR